MVRFLHTSDWQLGMTRHFFSEGAQERYNQARFDVIRTLGRIAEAEKCQFVAVCGDAFESNQVEFGIDAHIEVEVITKQSVITRCHSGRILQAFYGTNNLS